MSQTSGVALRVPQVLVAIVLSVGVASAQAPAAPGGQGPAPSGAQAPSGPPGPPGAPGEQRFKNLKVFPEDISRDQLLATMRNFAGSLGVRCTFCHVGNSPQTMDFASDDKDEKRNARVMIKMTQAINRDTLPQLDGMSDNAEVTCYTCHRGADHPPRRLSDMLADTASEKGADAAMQQYDKLRRQSLEAGQYDFRTPMLIAAATQLREAHKLDESIGLLRAIVALSPQSSDVATALGMTLMEKGDKAGAEAELTRALSLDPNNRMARGALDRLHGVQPQR